MWISRQQSSTSSEVDARLAAVQLAPAAVSRSAENEVVIPRQRASGLGGSDSRNSVLDNQADARFQTEPATRHQEDIGGRLLADDVLTDHHRVEGAGRKAKRTEVALDLDSIGARGHR